MAEPLITVKKADGTTVRLPLSEVKKMSTGIPTASPAAVTVGIPTASSTKENFRIPVPEDAGIAAADPLAAVKKLLSTPELPAAPYEPLLTETHLLHEELEPHEIKHPDLVAQVSYEDSALAAIKNAKINLSPELSDRFHSLATSLYKGVRTLDQVMNYASLPSNQGGLGLTPTEVERLVIALESVPGTPKLVSKPRVSSPVGIQNQVISKIPVKPLQTLGQPMPMRDVEAPPMPKQSMQVMGPVEEMKTFSLVDWRRLAATPAKAKEIMLNKFASFKKESYFLFQDARLAWYASPLLNLYQKSVVDALNAGERLSGQTVNRTGDSAIQLTSADIMAIVEINQSLAV